MTQQSVTKREEWLKVLGKGMVTLPKKWRDELGITTGDRVKAKKEGNTVIIESAKEHVASYRVYTDEEIDEFLKVDVLPILEKDYLRLKAEAAQRRTSFSQVVRERLSTIYPEKSQSEIKQILHDTKVLSKKLGKKLRGFDSVKAIREMRMTRR